MLTKVKIGIITMLGILLGILMMNYAVGNDTQIIEYISGKYGKKCYPVGEEHGNIKYPVKFQSLEECLEYTVKN